MRSLNLILILSFLSILPAFGEYRGYEAVNTILAERLISPDSPFGLAVYLGEPIQRIDNSLRDLLGTYNGSVLGSKFRNGKANPVSILLWYTAFEGLARDIVSRCEGEAKSSQKFSERFVQSLMPLCNWPSGDSKSDSTLFAFWVSLMDFDAPEEEFLAWKAYFTSSESSLYKEVISAMVISIFMNPHFLLKK